MLTMAYREALVELLEILKYASPEDINKIPKKLMIFFKKNASPTYKFTIDKNVEIKNLKLKKETKGLLTMIYRNYWCTSEKRSEYDKLLIKNQKKLESIIREKYNPDKIFEKAPVQEIQETTINEVQKDMPDEVEQALVEYNQSVFFKIIDKIKFFFSKFAHNT